MPSGCPTASGVSTLSTGEVRHYDALFVCNGHHWDPRWPEPRFPGKFDGIELHSHDYIDPFDPVDMRGKKVIVVGIGNSGIDISSDLGQRGLADKVYISTRRGAHVMPLYLFGKPADKGKTVSWLPLPLQRRIIEFVVWMNVGKMENYGLPKPDHRLLETHPSCSGTFLTRVGSGDITPKPNIAELMGKQVRFSRRQHRRRRRHHLRHRLQDHLPVLRRGLPVGARQQAAALPPRHQTRPRQPVLHRPRAAAADPHQLRRAAGQVAGRADGRQLSAALDRARWRRRSPMTRSASSAMS